MSSRSHVPARRKWLRLTLLASAGTVAVSLLLPPAALAHGIAGKTDLPVPRWLFAWAAAVVLIVSFVALATLWPKPRLERARARVLLRLPPVLDPICGAIGVALFAIVVYAGLAGEQELPTANLTPTFIYVLFWVGLPFLSLPFGDVFRAFNPWRAIARAVAWAAAKVTAGNARLKPRPYPQWLGRWPAVVGILGFAWLELIYVEHDKPSTLAWLALGYAAVQWVGMGLYGIETWTSRADAFAVYFNLFSKLSPLHWYRDRLELRPPLSGLTSLEPLAGTVALLAAMIGSTSFDGLEQGTIWINTLYPELQSVFSGLGSTAAAELSGTVGLLAMVAIIGLFYRLGIRGMQTIDPSLSSGMLAGRFVHTLVPIALAYVVAHYWSLFVYQSQAIYYLASDPLGNGSNIFGTAGGQIDFSVLSPNSIWYVQVGALLLGHASGLALAHDRALTLYRQAADAIRSQYWMLVVMVAFTSLGLWLLSAAS
ncbi:MAG: fenitrothion hydrolase [Solirubrobacterales bacterium]|nr:fenitrothion hydrolase [Solirubrobacterales bacterium]